jgi:hypothetical protein
MEVRKADLESRGGFVIWLSRLLLLVLCGYPFRSPLSPLTKLLLIALNLSFALGLIGSIQQEAALAGRHCNIAVIVQSADFATWLECIITAIFIVYFLHQQPPFARRGSVALCGLLAFAMLTNRAHLRLVLPFHTLNRYTSLFGSLLVFSTVYHFRQRHADFERYTEHVLSRIRGAREAFTDTNILSQKKVEQEAAKGQASRKSAEATAEATDRRNKYAKWTNSINYHPLVGDDIRLLEVLPAAEGQAAELRCRLRHVSLFHAENSYTAVSYCWGDDLQERHISIGEDNVRITANLDNALREIRGHGCRLLWIDALCVDQQNWHERNAQVLRMAAIYKKAKEVVAWLGAKDPGSHRIMTLLQVISAGQNVTIEDLFPKRGGPSLDDFKAFMARPYWRRIWIIQEVAAASQVFLACCGKRVSLDSLHRLIDNIVDQQYVSPIDWPKFYEELQLILDILEIRRRRIFGEPLRLLEALVKTRASMSTMAHDKVFGLLGLTIDQDHFVTVPDYKLPENEMCKTMTRSFILSKQKLDIILAGPRPLGTSSLPSWCPDYLHVAEAPLNHTFVQYLCGDYKQHRMGEQQAFWNTTAPSHAILDKSCWLQDDVLRVMGLRIGTIYGLGPTINPTVGDRQELHSVVRRDNDIGRRHSLEPPTPSYSTYDGLCRMLLIYDSKYSKFTNAPVLLGMLFNPAYQLYAASSGGNADLVVKWLTLNANFDIYGRKLRDRAWFSALKISGNYFKGLFKADTRTVTIFDYAHVTNAVAKVIKEGLRLITTREGAVGWAHQDAEVNDEIFIFAGCSVPVILRRHPGRKDYHLVGHAYVDGYMNGEKWGKAEPSRLAEVIIC